MSNLENYVRAFFRVYRKEVEYLFQREPDAAKKYPSGYFFKEPCQVEIFDIGYGGHCVWILLFAEDEPDLRVRIHKTSIDNIRHHIYVLAEKYPKLYIDPDSLTETIYVFNHVIDGIRRGFGIANLTIEGDNPIVCLCFQKSLRKSTCEWRLTLDNSAQNVAHSLFVYNFASFRTCTYEFRTPRHVFG